MVTNEPVITYRVTLTHNDKGVAFNAREALKRSTVPPSGLVVQARFQEEPSSSRSTIIVSLRDDRNEAYLREVIERSHLVHPGAKLRIESIHPLVEEEGRTIREGGLQAKLTALEERYQQANTDLNHVRDENARLKRRLDIAGKVSSPLEGLLGYFDQLQLDVSKVVDDDFDLRYLRKVFSGEVEDTFDNYINFGREIPLTREEIQEVEQFDYTTALQELQELVEKVQEAQEQLEYVQGLEEGKIPIPPVVKKAVIQSIRALEPDKTVARYQELKGSTEQKKERRQMLSKQRDRYKSLSDHRGLLEAASGEIPVILNYTGDTIEIYFPFQSKKVKPAFIRDLTEELQSSYAFTGKDVQIIDHKFLAYTIHNPGDLTERIMAAVPFPLRVAGFNRIVRYQLGG